MAPTPCSFLFHNTCIEVAEGPIERIPLRGLHNNNRGVRNRARVFDRRRSFMQMVLSLEWATEDIACYDLLILGLHILRGPYFLFPAFLSPDFWRIR